jgi:maltose/maltodextrin transport system substrate-binding protein
MRRVNLWPTPLGLAQVCVAAMGLTTLTLSNVAQAQNKPSLLIWINGDKGYNGLQKVGDAFTKVSGVPVVVQHPEGAPDKFQSAAGAGKGPDIFCWAHDRIGEWASGGLIVPVQPSKKLRAEIDENAWKAVSYRGRSWAYPIAMEAIGLIYNKALVKEVPSNFDEVMKLDQQLKAQGKSAILWDYNKAFFSWPLLAGAGASVFDRNAEGDLDPNKVGIAKEGGVQAVEMIDRLIKQGHMARGAKYAEMEAGFAQGKVAMMITGPWAWENARKAKIDFGVGRIPGVIAGKPSRPFVGVLGCMITAPSKYKDIAREFIENHLLKVDSLKTIAADVPLGVPANKAYAAELASDPNLKATIDNISIGEPMPNIPQLGKFWAALDAALEAVTNGRQSAADAMKGAAARMGAN